MAALETYDKIDNLSHKCFQMTLSKYKNQNFQSNKKISITAYFFCANFFTSFTYSNTMMLLENTFNCQLPVKKRNIFYLATPTLHLSILDIVKFLSSCMLEAKDLYMLQTLKIKIKVEILQLRVKFQTAVVSCSRFTWITNSSDRRRV